MKIYLQGGDEAEEAEDCTVEEDEDEYSGPHSC